MRTPPLVAHDHRIFRVVRQSWADPLDASFSRRAADNRWNTPKFAALYCCCSELVARAVTLDIFRTAGVEFSDLQPAARPQLVELEWSGEVVDAASREGIANAGLPRDYPAGVTKETTRRAAKRWHAAGRTGVLCRSASVDRMGVAAWNEPHEKWSEVAIFVANCAVAPRLVARRSDSKWLSVTSPAQAV